MKDDTTPFRQIDLSDTTLATLATYGGRISGLLEAAHKVPQHDLIATLDDLLGAVYALIAAQEQQFVGKTSVSEFLPIATRAREVAAGHVRDTGNWMAGYQFNNAMFRISAIFDRLPQSLGYTHGTVGPEFQRKNGHPWDNSAAHQIREEVNKIKHDKPGVYNERKADMAVALKAMNQLIDLAEGFQFSVDDSEVGRVQTLKSK